jgi:hypothetical protein
MYVCKQIDRLIHGNENKTDKWCVNLNYLGYPIRCEVDNLNTCLMSTFIMYILFRNTWFWFKDGFCMIRWNAFDHNWLQLLACNDVTLNNVIT